MGNTRGNTYSRNHVSFDPCPSCPDFWNFGFDDTGVKDYSAEIDYILEINADYEKMHFVGHSMGCTQFVVSTLISLIKVEVGINVEAGILWKKNNAYLPLINEELRVEKI